MAEPVVRTEALTKSYGRRCGRRQPGTRDWGCVQVAVAGHLLYAFGRILDALEPWMVLSPFQHALGNDPLVNVLSVGYAAAIAAAGAVLLLAALPVFSRRDIAVQHEEEQP